MELFVNSSKFKQTYNQSYTDSLCKLVQSAERQLRPIICFSQALGFLVNLLGTTLVFPLTRTPVFSYKIRQSSPLL